MKFLRSRNDIKKNKSMIVCSYYKTHSHLWSGKHAERSLKTFENKIWRKICGPIVDEITGNRRMRYNGKLYDSIELAPLTSFVEDITVRSHNEEKTKQLG